MNFNTYVVNLDSQKKRYDVQEKKLNEVEIYPIRISGYRFEDIDKSELQKQLPQLKELTKLNGKVTQYEVTK